MSTLTVTGSKGVPTMSSRRGTGKAPGKAPGEGGPSESRVERSPAEPGQSAGGAGGTRDGPALVAADTSWIHVQSFFKLCAYIISSRERTANAIRIMMVLEIGLALAAIFFHMFDPSLRLPVHFGLATAGVGASVTITGLYSSWRRRRKGNDGDKATDQTRHKVTSA